MKFDAIIFDLDGTLLDTLDDIADSVNAALAAHGHPTYPAESYKHFVGNGLEMLLKRAVGAPVGDDEMRSLITRYKEEYARRFLDKTRPYDGIPELVDSLYESKIRLAVVSNKIERISRALCDRFFPGKFGYVYGELI